MGEIWKDAWKLIWKSDRSYLEDIFLCTKAAVFFNNECLSCAFDSRLNVWHPFISCYFQIMTLEGRIQVTIRRRRGRKHLLDDLKEERWYFERWEEALDRTVCRSRFERGYEHFVRQTRECLRMKWGRLPVGCNTYFTRICILRWQSSVDELGVNIITLNL
jgi:hypothetical protein